jgi:ELWxxDGT repeat protein
MNRTTLLFPSLLVASLLSAQGAPALLRDLGLGATETNRCYATRGATLAGVHYFGAWSLLGQELWRSDGTPAGTYCVRDLNTNGNGDVVVHRTWNGRVLFSGTDGAGTGYGLWSTNGSAAGTEPLAATTIAASCVWNGSLYFTASDSLWRTDGTPAGTVQVQWGLGSGPSAMVAAGAQFFVVYDHSVVWRSDGTAAGTVPIATLEQIESIAALPSGVVLFAGDDGTAGLELWRSDGSAAGTYQLADLWPGIDGSEPHDLCTWNGAVWFGATDGQQEELWRSDGSIGGTTMVDVHTGPVSSGPMHLVPGSTRLWFVAYDSGTGHEVWRTDGTQGGTQRVSDIYPGIFGSNPADLQWDGTWLWFSADDGTHGRELWRTNGTTAQLAADTWPGGIESNPAILGFAGSACLFVADDPNHVGELHASTGAGSTFVRDVYPDYPTSSGPTLFSPNPAGWCWFGAVDPAAGLEPHRSNGTTAGTGLITNTLGIGSSISPPSEVAAHRGFTWWSGFSGLWRTDGTDPGTAFAGYVGLYDVVQFQGRLYHVGFEPSVLSEVFYYDDPLGPRTLLKDIAPGTLGNLVRELTVVGNRLCFVANDGTGEEIWISDGTTAGTVQLVDLSAAFTNLGPGQLTAVGRRLFFRGPFQNDGLWVSDGTAAGTTMIPGHVPMAMVAVGKRLFFVSNDGNGLGRELWVTDGTTTTLCRDIRAGSLGSDPRALTAFGNGVLFFADDGVNGSELWRSDGTLLGTQLVRDIGPGAIAGAGSWIHAPAGAERATFAATTGTSGLELWRTDGTTLGTVLHAELEPGFDGSYPGLPARAGTSLFFAATTTTHGREPFVMPTMACCEPLGTACGTSLATTPIASGIGAPRLGNFGFGIAVDAGPGTVALAVVGELTEVPLWPCDLRVASFGSPLVVLTDNQGRGTVPIPIANNPVLLGLRAGAQWATLDPNGPLAGFLALSNGLELVLAAN